MKRVMALGIVLASVVNLQAEIGSSGDITEKARALELQETLSINMIKVVNIDTGGVRGDKNCTQPVKAFIAAVESLGLKKDEVLDLIYGNMGMSKKPHLRSIIFSEKGKRLFSAVHNRDPQEADVDKAYTVFLDIQRGLLQKGYPIVPGCEAAHKKMKQMGLTVIGTTGYDREMCDLANTWLAKQGSVVEASITPEDAGGGRPAPWQIHQVMKKAYELTGEYIKPSEVVTIDDTPAGMKAGRNAGTWCIGIAGTSILQNQYPNDSTKISDALFAAGAHMVVNSIADVPEAIESLNSHFKNAFVSPETFNAWAASYK